MAYTDMELKAIGAFKVAFNYSDAKSEKDDNATALKAADIAKHSGLSLNQSKGLIGSLTKKGLLQDWGDDLPDCSFITEFGIDEHYANFEREPSESDQGLIPIPDGYAEQ